MADRPPDGPLRRGAVPRPGPFSPAPAPPRRRCSLAPRRAGGGPPVADRRPLGPSVSPGRTGRTRPPPAGGRTPARDRLPPALTTAAIQRQATAVAARQGWAGPSYTQVSAIVRRLDPALVALAQEGTKAYRDRFDLLYRREAAGPNAIWQADDTRLDIRVRDEAGQSTHPWFTVVLDDHSRAVAGFRVGVEPPSALRRALTLRQAIWPKGDAHWPVCGIPDVFYTDHGRDFTSYHLEQTAADLRMRLIFSLPGMPRGRGRIERFFGTVNQLFLCTLPGYVPDRTDPPPVLTLAELEARLHDFLVADYHQRRHGETGVAPKTRWEAGGFLPRLPQTLENRRCSGRWRCSWAGARWRRRKPSRGDRRTISCPPAFLSSCLPPCSTGWRHWWTPASCVKKPVRAARCATRCSKPCGNSRSSTSSRADRRTSFAGDMRLNSWPSPRRPNRGCSCRDRSRGWNGWRRSTTTCGRHSPGWSRPTRRRDARLAGALTRFWFRRADYGEGWSWLERGLALWGSVPIAVRAQALVGAGRTAVERGDPRRGEARLVQGLALWRSIGNREQVAVSCSGSVWP